MPWLSEVVIKHPKIFPEYFYKLFVQCIYVKKVVSYSALKDSKITSHRICT